MATARFLSLVAGVIKMVVPNTTSAGGSDSGKIVALNASGQIDPTMIAVKTSSAGAGDSGKIVALNASGKVDSTMIPAATVPANTPRDRQWAYAIASPIRSQLNVVGFYDSPTTNAALLSWATDAFGRGYGQYTSAATIHTQVQFSNLGPMYATLQSKPSSRIVCGLVNPTISEAYVLGFTGGNAFNPGSTNPTDGALTTSSPSIGFRGVAGTDTSWQIYISDGTNAAQTINTGVAIDANMHTFDVICNSATNYSFAIDGVFVGGTSVTATHAPLATATYTTGIFAVTTTATAIAIQVHSLYVGLNA